MHLSKKILFTLCSILIFVSVFSLSGNGLPAYKIKGVVLNSETGAPIPLAEAFISGTTFGSITNSEGVFELNSSYLPCQLVVSHISYAPFSMKIDKESKSYITIKLITYEHEIREITIEARNTRRENMKLFKKAFLGMDQYASTCSILNDSVLSFSWDSSVFSASAYQPLLIENGRLGYSIKIILNDFKLIYKPEAYKKIQKSKTGKYCKTRIAAYYGSRMHFLRSLYLGDPKEHGYDIKPDFGSVPVRGASNLHWSGIEFIFLDPEGYPKKHMIYPEEPMIINYVSDESGEPINLNLDKGIDLIHHQSKLTFGSRKCIIRSNGTTFDYSLIFSGYIGGQRVANLLPDDFIPGD